MGCQREAPVHPFNRVGNGASACVWRAIISSSLVGITQAETRLEAVLMARTVSGIGRRIELNAEPGSPPAHRFAYRDGALADAGDKHDSIEAAEGSGEDLFLRADEDRRD